MASTRPKQVMDSIAVNRSVTRLAHEILERNGGADQLMLVGILTRGEPLAKRLQSLIQKIAEVEVPMGSVDITFHRDDFRDRLVVPQVKAFGRPNHVQLAVLVDRGHRELPIRADFVGKNIPTHEGEHVEVQLKEVDGKDLVTLTDYSEEG